MHEARDYAPPVPRFPPRSQKEMLGCAFINADNMLEFSVADRRFDGKDLHIVADWDQEGAGSENLAEEQSRKLAHSGGMRAKSDATTKPNREQMEKLQRIVDAPHSTTALNGQERDLLYTFRYSLTDSKRALTKVLLSIEWDVETETEEVGPLLEQWRTCSAILLFFVLLVLPFSLVFSIYYCLPAYLPAFFDTT